MNRLHIRALFRKELGETLRDRRMVFVLFLAPILQTLIFGYAVTSDIRNAGLVIADADNSALSRDFARSISDNEHFRIVARTTSETEALAEFSRARAVATLVIRHGFARDIGGGKSAPVQVIVDGSDPTTAGIVTGYIVAGANDWQARRVQEKSGTARVTLETRNLYNPALASIVFMLPGVIVTLLSLITVLMTAMAITREREAGTLEQLIVSPISAAEIVIGKALPFVLFGIIDAILVIVFGTTIFGIGILGSPLALALSAVVFIMASIGIGLLISTWSMTQQQAMLTFFFYMLPCVVLSGFMFPIENMPEFFQAVSMADPMRYFLECLRGVMLRGNSLAEIWPWMAGLAGFAVLTVGLGMFRFRKKCL